MARPASGDDESKDQRSIIWKRFWLSILSISIILFASGMMLSDGSMIFSLLSHYASISAILSGFVVFTYIRKLKRNKSMEGADDDDDQKTLLLAFFIGLGCIIFGFAVLIFIILYVIATAESLHDNNWSSLVYWLLGIAIVGISIFVMVFSGFFLIFMAWVIIGLFLGFYLLSHKILKDIKSSKGRYIVIAFFSCGLVVGLYMIFFSPFYSFFF